MCQRNLRVPLELGIGAAIVFVALFFVMLGNANRLKSRVSSWSFSPDKVLDATEKLVAKNPEVHNPVGFSPMEQSKVEHWDAYRWRVSGFVDSAPDGGSRKRTLFFAVVTNSGRDWEVEDLQLQNIESAPPRHRPRP